MYFAYIVIGLFVGLAFYDAAGPILGMVIGFLLAKLVKLSARVNQLHNDITALKESNRNDTNQQGASEEKTNSRLKNTYADIDKQKEETKEASVVTSPTFSEEIFENGADAAQQAQLNKEKFDVGSDSISPKELLTSDAHASETADEKFFGTEYTASNETGERDQMHSQADKTSEPAEPSWLESAINQVIAYVKDFFMGGNTIVRVGMLLLFIGAGFLFKYISERVIIAVEYRYIGVGLFSLGLLYLGLKLRHKRPGFALSIQGGALGLMYLTAYAALRLHELLPASSVFIVMLALVILSVGLAIWQNSLPLAALAAVGGFSAPVLASTGTGSHVELFSYYALLNVGLFVVAWFKSWRLLNLIGFVFTFVIGGLWGAKYYKPEFFSTVEPFLIFFFLIYTAMAVLFALRQKPQLKGITDSTLIFGNVIVSFGIQAALVKDMSYGLAYSAVALAVFYLLSGFLLKRIGKAYLDTLITAFYALGIGFATLAIPLAFDGRLTSAIWAVEGAAMAWIGIKQSRFFPRYGGYALILFASAAFLADPLLPSEKPWLNASFLGIVMLAAANFWAAFIQSSNSTRISLEKPLARYLFSFIGLSWWLLGNLHELYTQFDQWRLLSVVFIAVHVVLTFLMGIRFKNPVFQMASLILSATLLILLAEFNAGTQAVLNPRFIAYGLAAMSLIVYSKCIEMFNFEPLMQRFLSEATLRIIMFSGCIVWLLNGVWEISIFASNEWKNALILAFILLSFEVTLWLARWLRWQGMQLMQLLLLPTLLIYAVYLLAFGWSMPMWLGFLFWVYAFALHLRLLREHEEWFNNDHQLSSNERILQGINYPYGYHFAGLWLFIVCGICHIYFWLAKYIQSPSIWLDSWVVTGVLLVAWFLYALRNRSIWPISTHSQVYRLTGLSSVLVILLLLVLGLNTAVPGSLHGMMYIPLLNPIDLVSALALILVYKRYSTDAYAGQMLSTRMVKILCSAIAFVVMNASLLRTFHFWGQMPYDFSAMMNSVRVQGALTLLWSTTAVFLMLYATRKQWRVLWLTGLGLMIVVVAKLFMIDLSASGSIERIVAFISVGVLLSVVGYFSPIPPHKQSPEEPRN